MSRARKQKEQTGAELSESGVRIDKWLWAARFFKTRSLASEAVNSGRVLVDGQKCKPSRTLKSGSTLRISKGDYLFEIEVLALSDKRGSATVAQTLYNESEASQQKRAELSERLRDIRSMERGIRGEGRPNKKQRRELTRLKHDV